MDRSFRHAKLSDYTLEKQLCNLFGTQLPCPSSTCSQNHVLCQMINTGEKGIIIICTRWQPSDEIHRPRSKPSFSNGQRFQQSWGCLCAIFSTLTNLTLLTNLLPRNSLLWPPHMSRQQSMHLFRPKMSRQLSVVDLIQQHLLTRRWHHQFRLLICALKDQFKPMSGDNTKLIIICTCSLSQLPHFNI